MGQGGGYGKRQIQRSTGDVVLMIGKRKKFGITDWVGRNGKREEKKRSEIMREREGERERDRERERERERLGG